MKTDQNLARKKSMYALHIVLCPLWIISATDRFTYTISSPYVGSERFGRDATPPGRIKGEKSLH
jgi:hypothetical protein